VLGHTHPLDIFEEYRMVNTNNKIASILKVNRDLISLSQHKENRRRV